jgi:hypothetical protein
MKLKDKFQQWFINDEDEHYEGMVELVSIEHEQIADEYAKQVLVSYLNSETLQYKQSQGVYSLDELLQIIKKQRGL